MVDNVIIIIFMGFILAIGLTMAIKLRPMLKLTNYEYVVGTIIKSKVLTKRENGNFYDFLVCQVEFPCNGVHKTVRFEERIDNFINSSITMQRSGATGNLIFRNKEEIESILNEWAPGTEHNLLYVISDNWLKLISRSIEDEIKRNVIFLKLIKIVFIVVPTVIIIINVISLLSKTI